MDTVYGTKKYFQSLSGASDIYRSTQACRAVSNNDYTYQNTLGRRSTLGAYYHMNKQPSYTNDHSLNSQYGYNTWGIWRDGRNIAPSTFSAKTHTHYQKTRSFSIILTTAAFIVLLAVISIAGLAFYFSSIKANMEDPVFGFEGSFRIAKGDLFSTGLKYNHTTTYKQKIEFYKRFVERALSDNGLLPLRTDVWGFGEGPLIKVSFRTFLDVRKLPQNIRSVEEHIRESLFLETTAMKSLYRSLRIDAESVEIKRILDEQVVKSASLFKEAQTVPTSQTQLEKRLMKKGGGSIPTLLSKPATTSKPRAAAAAPAARPHSPDDEPDIDVENAPVIQGSFEGSFEITKTDADIARKKVTPTKAYSSSLPPKAVTPFALRVKPKKPTIEKLTTIIPQQQQHQQTRPTTTTTLSTTARTTASIATTTTKLTTTKPTTTRRTTTTRKTTTTTTTTTPEPTTTTTTTTPATTTTTIPTTTTTPTTPRAPSNPPTKSAFPNHFTYPVVTPPTATMLVPKLDSNLFTSIPVLDTQPWRPIHREVPELLPGPPPAFPTKTLPIHSKIPLTAAQTPRPNDLPQRRIDEMELPFLEDNPTPPIAAAFDPYAPDYFSTTLRKPDTIEDGANPQDMMFYHSFGNPVFMPGAEGIERLGTGASVQPHPLPVPLLDDIVIPPFKPLHATLGTNEKLPFNIEAGDTKFEHLGGGVIVKKHNDSNDVDKVQSTTTAAAPIAVSQPTTQKLDDINVGSSTLKPLNNNRVAESTANSELAHTIGEFFMDLLNLPKDEKNGSTTQASVESRIVEEEENLDDEQQGTQAANVEAVEEAVKEPIETTSRQQQLEEATPTTNKPNFMNLKELILQRNQAANKTSKVETTTISAATTTTTTERSTLQPPTKRNRIRPVNNKQPSIVDDSSLFPSHSKWEFVNSSSTNNYGHTGNMRKVFNKTLQAWVSEDVEKTENFTLNDIKTRINNATNIQDISLIFDTLASKLGITPSVPTKVPPFSQNKLKQTLKNDTRAKQTITSTTAATTTSSAATTAPASDPTTTQFTPTTKRFIELPLQRREPFIKPMSSFLEDSSSEGVGAAIPVVGEAEVEVIDPTKYEEMLKSSQFADATTTETSHRLVTLLPVRSNSGIRTYRPQEETQQQRSAVGSVSSEIIVGDGSTGRSSITRKSDLGQSRRFPPPEAVVKGGLKVTVK